ncbi:MAG: hypothetical protein ACTHOK_13655, partial [Nocardioidaceae bacterium]
MVILLAFPVFAAVALVHRCLQLYAPSNLLARRVRIGTPRLRISAGLLAVGATLLIAMHIVAVGIAAGAPGWLNLLVLVLAWDAIKVGWLALGVAARLLLRSAAVGARLVHGTPQRSAASPSRSDSARPWTTR